MAKASWADDVQAVTDVLGTILLVGITVAAAIGFNMLILNIPGPADQVYVDLTLEVLPGSDGEFGTGDEQVQLQHLWGEPLHETRTRFILDIGGQIETIGGDDLQFSQGVMVMGDVWSVTRTIEQEAEVQLAVVDEGVADGIRFEEKKTARHERCLLDVRGPSAVFTQSPEDASGPLGSADVVITAVLSDICSGVADVAPTLHYNLGTGSPVTMTKQSGTTYTANIPAPGGDWATVAGQTLDYHLEGMQDTNGNTAISPDITDFIQSTPPGFIFVGDPTMAIGTASNWAGAKALDDNAHGTLTTGLSGSSGTYTLNANEVVKAHIHWGDTDKGYTQNDVGPKYKKSVSHPIILGLQDPPGSPGAITDVTIHVRQFQKETVNDGWRIGACILESCSTVSQVIPATATWTTIEYDVTKLRPGGGPWQWSDLNDLRVKLSTQTQWDPTNKNGFDEEWKADHIYVTVDYSPGQGLDAQATFSSIPASGSYTLEARYRTSVDQFRLSVWDGTQWNVKSPDLTETKFTAWSTTLSAAEYNSGDPKVRIESLSYRPSQVASIDFDYLLVRS